MVWHWSFAIARQFATRAANCGSNGSRKSFCSGPALAEWSGPQIGSARLGSSPRRTGKFLPRPAGSCGKCIFTRDFKKMILNDKKVKKLPVVRIQHPRPWEVSPAKMGSPVSRSFFYPRVTFYLKVNLIPSSLELKVSTTPTQENSR